MEKSELIKKKIGLVSLGCDKNRVDSERILYSLKTFGFTITSKPDEANILIINTCAFIEPARKESIDTILEMAQFKEKNCEKLIVVGCLPQKFYNEVVEALPEVDCFLGVKNEKNILKTICDLYNINCCVNEVKTPLNRVLSTPNHYAFLKIAEGCSNHCAYCTIPEIRGEYISEPIENLIQEATQLAKNGVSELILVAQDVTKYGIDIYKKFALVDLLQKLSQIEGIIWIRLHYCYPEFINNELINEIKNNPKICKYIEVPLQHADDKILKLMKRATSYEQAISLIKKLRDNIPNIAIRTSFILGFPGETESEYKTLKNFITTEKLDHIGFFVFSKEKGTDAEKLPNQVNKKTAKKRVKELSILQANIVEQKNKEKIGKKLKVVCENKLENNTYLMRSEFNSPNVDTFIYVNTEKVLEIGQYYNIIVTNVLDKFDLIGELL